MGNRQYLNQPLQFKVRFVKQRSPISLGQKLLVPLLGVGESSVVADRAFNGLNIALAYLGDSRKDVKDVHSKVTSPILSVKVDPNNPNRQITFLRGERQLVSVVTGRAREISAADRLIATEVSGAGVSGQEPDLPERGRNNNSLSATVLRGDRC